jgi:GH15 family glucan-1,4-alpha-glucosidase
MRRCCCPRCAARSPPQTRGQSPPFTRSPHSSPEDGDCYRHRPDERPLGPSEGAFLLCGFLMTLAYAQQGDHLTAARWFERNRAACGPPGLWEEFDVTQRQLDGNLPQAFVHALLLECAVEQYSPAETQ